MRQQNNAPGGPGGAGNGADGASSVFKLTTFAAAANYIARGWAVLPLRPRGKEPLTARGFQDATTDPEAIAAWWRRWPEANVAIATGSPSGVVVLDVDPRSGGDESLRDLEARHGPLPNTPTVLTGGGGQHYYFALPQGVTIRTRKMAPGLDLKGEGGYVVAPPSVHPSGRRYEWELGRSPDDLPLAPLPAWLLKEGDHGRREWQWDGEPVPEGRRHMHLVSLAGKLRAAGLGIEAIEVALLLENERRCLPPLPEREVQAIARSMANYPPRVNLPGNDANNGHAPHEALADTVSAIYITPGAYDLAKAVDQAWEALLAANRPPRLFRQGDAVVEVEDGEARVVGMGRMRELLARAASWLRPTPHGPLPVPPPEAVAQAMLERPHQDLPVLRGVVRSPILTEEGIIATPGYDATTGLYYATGPGLEGMPPVPAQPTAEDVAEAKRLLLEELLGDFPFDSQASRAGAVAMLLTPFLRELIDGSTPLFLLDKPTPGSGATLLAAAIALTATGREPTYLPPRESEEEWRKAITSALMQGAGVVLIDNAKALSSATLSSAITATTWADRLLGRNSIVSVPNLAVWAVTGNNPTLSLELARRCVRVRLEPPTERPWTRTGFRHPHLLGWVKENRGRLVWAALVLGQHWLARGRPSPSCPRPGMFEAWAEAVGGVLEAAGIEGFLENALELYEEAEASSFLERGRALVAMWWRRFGEEVVTVPQLLEAAQEERLEEEPVGKREKDRLARRLGTMLRQLRGRVFDLGEATVRVTKTGVDARTKQGRWRLVRLNGPQRGAEHAECAECPKAGAGLPERAADGPDHIPHIPHIPQPPPGLRLKGPPTPDDGDDPWAAFEVEKDEPPTQDPPPQPEEDPPPLPPDIRLICPRCGGKAEILRTKAQCLRCLLVFSPPRIRKWALEVLWEEAGQGEFPDRERLSGQEFPDKAREFPDTAGVSGQFPDACGEFPDGVSGQSPRVSGHGVSGQVAGVSGHSAGVSGHGVSGQPSGVSGHRVSGQPEGVSGQSPRVSGHGVSGHPTPRVSGHDFPDGGRVSGRPERVSGQPTGVSGHCEGVSGRHCPGCGRWLSLAPTGRPRRWCSDACRKRLKRRGGMT